MNRMELLIGIVERKIAPSYEAQMEHQSVHLLFSLPAKGTAKSEMLRYLGLDSTEKTLLLGVMSPSVRQSLLREFRQQQPFRRETAITASIPLSSIGGKTALSFVTDGQKMDGGETMEQAPFELVMAIANYGTTELVMDAARSAGARGGTVVHAKGTGVDFAEKFFGVSLSVEKEIVLILTKREQRNEIMRAIMEKAGLSSKAHSVVFSLPVDQVSGIAAFEA